jgi:hypothetical protein
MMRLTNILNEVNGKLPTPTSIQFARYEKSGETDSRYSTTPPNNIQDINVVKIEFKSREDRDSFRQQLPKGLEGTLIPSGLNWSFRKEWLKDAPAPSTVAKRNRLMKWMKSNKMI